MKRYTGFFISVWLVIVLAGCAHQSKDKSGPKANLPGYLGPKAKISIADFKVNAPKAATDSGAGLRKTLITSLSNSGRFIIVEPQESPDLVIEVALAEFEPQSSGGKAGLGGGGGVHSGLMGGFWDPILNKAHMGLDVRIENAPDSALLAATRIQSQAQDVAAENGASSGTHSLGPELSAYANTPMEKAIRECMVETARYISQAIPAEYYKY